MNHRLPDRPADPAARFSPACERNTAPLLEQLTRLLPARGQALEIASGSGQHVAAFAAALEGWQWQPSDPDPGAAASVAAWCRGLPPGRVAPALALDVRRTPWPVSAGTADLVLAINMIHISPWDCCEALMRGAAAALRPGGLLLTYGPYLEDEVPTAASNLAFDADLRSRDPAWGLRRREDVEACARAAGLRPRERVAMPANNLLLVFEAEVVSGGAAA